MESIVVFSSIDVENGILINISSKAAIAL
jgi:hypothetical protein